MIISSMTLPDLTTSLNAVQVVGKECVCPSQDPGADATCVTSKESKTDDVKVVEAEKRGGRNAVANDDRFQDVDRDYLEGLGVLKDSRHYLLVALVLSGPDGRNKRDAIRETWKTYCQPGEEPAVLVQFVIGTFGLSQPQLEAITQEQQAYHDLVLLPHLEESYYNLTLKLLQSFVWADEKLKFSYLLKCDDDSFVMLHLIAEELSERTSSQSYYWGFFDGRATPKKAGKYIEKEWFLCDRYLPYALGGGYVVSADLVHKVSLVSDGLRLYNNEDTSMGVWLSPYKAERRHDSRFDTEFKSRGCRNRYIVSHKQSPEDMRSKYELLQSRGVLCEREYQVRKSYEYNWNVEPSKCCERT
jgi:galactosylxylosylprotein 3-beta-galactosyltransferase